MCIRFRVHVSRILVGDAAQRDPLLEGSPRRIPIGQVFLHQALIGRRAGLAAIAAGLDQRCPRPAAGSRRY
jgi:hypothetical protein